MSTSSGRQNPALELLNARASRVVTKEGIEYAMNFIPQSNDVIVVAPPKCGTTWMTQIVHQLRSRGDMSFADIDDVVPWIDLAYDIGLDLNADHKYQPRCFKTHAFFNVCPKGAKYILVYREPCAAAYSAFKFLEGAHFQHGEITLDEFVRDSNSKWNYFKHLLSWWPARNDSNVLFFLYEDMLEDLESVVRTVASFMGIDDQASIANAVRTSSFDFMKQNQKKFETNRVSKYRNRALGLPEENILPRVVTGSATKGREMMSESTKQAVQQLWTDTVTKELGFQDYNELRDCLKK